MIRLLRVEGGWVALELSRAHAAVSCRETGRRSFYFSIVFYWGLALTGCRPGYTDYIVSLGANENNV